MAGEGGTPNSSMDNRKLETAAKKTYIPGAGAVRKEEGQQEELTKKLGTERGRKPTRSG